MVCSQNGCLLFSGCFNQNCLVAFSKLPLCYLSNSTRTAFDRAFGAEWPKLELLVFDGYAGYNCDLVAGAPMDGKHYATLFAVLTAPISRVNVTIGSNSPGWLLDQEVAVAAFKAARSLFRVQAWQPVRVGSKAFPSANVTTCADILNLIRQSAPTPYHASSTCAMGKKDDPMAVIDDQARVIGVHGLRVVHASSFPLLPPGHPQATVLFGSRRVSCHPMWFCSSRH